MDNQKVPQLPQTKIPVTPHYIEHDTINAHFESLRIYLDKVEVYNNDLNAYLIKLEKRVKALEAK